MTNPGQYERTYQDGLTKTQKDLERFFREDGKNIFTQEIWNQKPNLTATNVNDVLNQAAPGLEWFRLALVRYHRVWDVLKLPGFDSIVVAPLNVDGAVIGGETIDATKDPDGEMRRLDGKWYDQQRGMDLTSLTTLADALQKAATGTDNHPSTDTIKADLAGVANAVPEVWQGQAGSAAQDHLAGFSAHADQQNQYLQAVTSALNGLPAVLLKIVQDKANFVAGFNTAQCPVAGHAMRLAGTEDPVSTMITVAKEGYWSLQLSDAPKIADEQLHFGGGYGDSSKYPKLQAAIKDWLTNHFAPAVREAFTAFVHQCALADHYIKQAYQPVTDLLDNHDQTPFPKPKDQQPTQQPVSPTQQPTAPQPTSPTQTTTASTDTRPAATQTPTQTTTPTPTQTPTTVASTTTTPLNPLQTLTSVASQVGQSVQQGISQVGQSVQQGISQLDTAIQHGLSGLNPDTKNNKTETKNNTETNAGIPVTSTPAGAKALANLNLGGDNVALTQAADGTIKATVTDHDGKARQYSMGFRDGAPVFTIENDKTVPSTAAGVSHDSGTPTSDPGTPARPATPITRTDSSSSPLAPASQSAAGPIPSGSPMSGSPMGGASGGNGATDHDRKSSGIVPPQPLWSVLPDPVGNVLESSPEPELAQAGPLVAEAAVADRHNELPIEAPPLEAPQSDPASVSSLRNDGVRIEIEMGDQR
ncbi:hypothetical protein ACQPW1_39365 [Nocardia sp. CA-128927]|uniref:WXG100 family type VII secretion target n=1 Tax=Nocardia sp. CA-128927 TaxID=3239975 RepID=UPI003D99C0EE